MSTVENGAHPLPSPPRAQQGSRYSHAPQRSKSTFSFRSDKSHKSNGSAGKVDLTETSHEKHARKLSSKADPRLAMSEAEPSAVAANVASALAPLRAIQHRDSSGNVISDPDRSNPTRSRWERPLDTIRSFEAAIDGNYNSRKASYSRTNSAESMSAVNRRSSYYGGSNIGSITPRWQPDGGRGYRGDGYGDRPVTMSRPESYFEQNGGPSNSYHPGRTRQMYPRTASEPMLNHGPSIYPPNVNPQSYETVTTASGSGSYGEPIGYATDPSSENSSVHRYQPPKIEFGEPSSHGGPPRPPPHAPSTHGWPASGNNSELATIYQGQSDRPPPQRYESTNTGPRVPIKLGTSVTGPTTYEAPRPVNEKRRSWFGRKFGKG